MCLFFLLMEKWNLFCFDNIDKQVHHIKFWFFCTQNLHWAIISGTESILQNVCTGGCVTSPALAAAGALVRINSSRCFYILLCWYQSAQLGFGWGTQARLLPMWSLSSIVLSTDHHHSLGKALHLFIHHARKFHLFCYLEKWQLLLKPSSLFSKYFLFFSCKRNTCICIFNSHFVM